MSDKTSFIFRFILFAAFHSLFATAWVKKVLNVGDSQVYRVCYNVVSLAMFGWVMSVYRHSEVLYFVPGAWSLVMYLLQLVLLAILLGCLRQTGVGEFIGYARRRTASSFTSSGWYSIVRHPLYLFSTLFMALTPVMTSQWLLLMLLSLLYFVIGGLIEERRLAVEFGEEYRNYQRRVPFIIPIHIRFKSLVFLTTRISGVYLSKRKQ